MSYSFVAKDITFSLDERGFVVALEVFRNSILRASFPLLRLCRDGRIYLPVRMIRTNDAYSFTFENGDTVKTAIENRENGISIEITEVDDAVDAVCFYAETTLDEVIGEVVGVVQGVDVAFGMMALNKKTVEGFPFNYEELLESITPYTDDQSVISVGRHPVSMRTVLPMKNGGSGFSFYCQNRTREAFGKVVGADNAWVRPLPADDPDAHIEGAKLLIYGCARSEALARIGEIEMEFGLPHPMIDGEWEKTARRAMKSYLISEFSADEVDLVLDKAEIAGMDTIYHSEPFRTWGHFEWQENLAENDADMYRKVTEKAKARNMKVGLHTLTNFITTNDAYVSPVPFETLVALLKTSLTESVDESATEIRVHSHKAFDTALTLNAVKIGREIVTYADFTEENGITTLTGLTRGAFGTVACAHAAGEEARLLRDYPYKTFFPDITLQDEMAERLVQLFNNTGAEQISFDGFEGCFYTGHGIYAATRFLMHCYDGWDHFVLNDGSGLHHFCWHFNTRMNWGEPWGEAMRTGQVAARISNQSFFARNLFPRMLGWFLLRLSDRKFEASTREDLEWAMSESAGFDAGYSMTIMPAVMRKHGRIDELLTQIREWDRLRLANVFTDEQKKRLCAPENEFRLEKLAEGKYCLIPLSISRTYTCALSEMQPGQPGGSDWSIENPQEASFAFRLRVVGEGEIRNIIFMSGGETIKFPCAVGENQYLLFDPDGRAEVTDRNYRMIEKVKPIGKLSIPHGTSAISFSCEHDRDDTPDVLITFITSGKGETIEMP